MTSLNRTKKEDLVKLAKKLKISTEGNNDELRDAIRKAQAKSAKPEPRGSTGKSRTVAKKVNGIWVNTPGVSKAHKALKAKKAKK